METRRLGRSHLEVTQLGFGAAPIGNLYTEVGDDTAIAAVDAAWSSGVRYFDTAPHYGLGLSERRLGQALASKPREEYVVSTKVGRVLVPNPAPTGSDLAAGGFAVDDALTRQRDYSRDGIRRSLDESLARLGLDYIDLVYIHDPDSDDTLRQALRQAAPALAELRDEGVIGAFGAGMNHWQPLVRFVKETEVDAVMVAGRWTLIDRSAAPLLDACEWAGVSVVAAAPFNSGLLALDWPRDGSYFDYAPASAELLARARELAVIARRNGIRLPHAAVQFPLQSGAVASVVAGMRSADQADDVARWASREIASSIWADFERYPRLTATT